MNFYDEEIIINTPSARNMNKVRINSIGSAKGEVGDTGSVPSSSKKMQPTEDERQSDEDDESSSSDQLVADGKIDEQLKNLYTYDENKKNPNAFMETKLKQNFATPKALGNDMADLSEAESDDEEALGKLDTEIRNLKKHSSINEEMQKSKITLETLQNLELNQGVKDILPYILKYTPQNIDTPYQLQPFIPEYVPSVGDVDAFLKVSIPDLLLTQQNLQRQIAEHLPRLGLQLLDEPSGAQSDPSLLNMKMHTVFSSGSTTLRTALGRLTPIARNLRDIDKWIVEVEQMHMVRSVYKAQPQIDIDKLVLNWPSHLGDGTNLARLQRAYEQCKREQISLFDFIRELCSILQLKGTDEMMPQSAYILNVFTLFCMYLVTHKAWE